MTAEERAERKMEGLEVVTRAFRAFRGRDGASGRRARPWSLISCFRVWC
jgi:hypothetical protein